MLLLYALSFALQVNTIRVEATVFLFCVAESKIRLPAAPSDGSSVRTAIVILFKASWLVVSPLCLASLYTSLTHPLASFPLFC